MKSNANDTIYRREVAHAIGLQRYGTNVVKDALTLLKGVERDLLARIAVNDNANKAAMEAYLNVVRNRMNEYRAALNATLTREGLALATYETDYQIALLEKASGRAIARVSSNQVAATVTTTPFQGRLLGEWASGLADATYNGVRDAVRIGYTSGETVGQIATRIRGTASNGYKDGVMGLSRRNAETVVRTAVSGIANTARELLYQENADLIQGVMWVSVLDNRTTEICAARDGEIYPVGEGPRPPAHPNCRSTTSTVFKGSPPPQKQTYAEWLRDQDKETVQEVLGKTKADLFLKGNLSLDRFVDNAGNSYTLEELKRRDQAAFNKI